MYGIRKKENGKWKQMIGIQNICMFEALDLCHIFKANNPNCQYSVVDCNGRSWYVC